MGRVNKRQASDPDSGATGALPSPGADVVSRRVGDEVVLVHLGTNRIFALSPTGARFWELLSDGRSRPEVEAQLLEEYDVSREEVSAEIDSLVKMLQAEGLVREG
jgi:Coenzyme PQQ synthesis protein D (PqqD)